MSALNSVKTEHIGHIPDPKRHPAGLAAAGRSGTGRVQCYQTPPFGRIPADKKPGGNRERTRTTERRPDYKARTGQIHPTTAEQAFSRDQPADLDLFAGRYCQKQRLEPLQTAARGRSGAARLSPNGTLGRRYENIHGQQGIPRLGSHSHSRHRRPQSAGHLPCPSGRAVPHRDDPLRLPRPVCQGDHPQRHREYAAAHRQHFRRERAGQRTGADHEFPEKPGLLQLLDQQHQLCRGFDRGRPAHRPDRACQAIHGRIRHERRGRARQQPHLPHPRHQRFSGLQPDGSHNGFAV